MLTFWYSSDTIPLPSLPVKIGQAYNKVFDDELWPASRDAVGYVYSGFIFVKILFDPYTGKPIGVKEPGPYQWVPPVFWIDGTWQRTFLDVTVNSNFLLMGAYGFLEEGGPGIAPLTWESLIQNVPADQLWPNGLCSPYCAGSAWNLHAGDPNGDFGTLESFAPQLYTRYGDTVGARDFTVRSQIAAYESHRAYFEVYARNKYTQGPNLTNATTGFINWMLENGRPQTIWHLFEYNGMPGGSYFGAKKACEALHPMLTPLIDDLINPPANQQVWVINSTYEPIQNVVVKVRIFTLDGTLQQEFASVPFNIDADVSLQISDLIIPTPAQLGFSGTYFVELRIWDGSPNVYWLSADPAKQDVMDWSNVNFDTYPQLEFADLTALATLPMVNLTSSFTTQCGPKECTVTVQINNPTPTIAFGVRLRLLNQNGVDILPIRWSDNFITIFLGESAIVTAQYDTSLNPGTTSLVLEPYNNLVNQPDPIV